MYDNVFVLDVEATSPTPMTGVMTEFALIHLVTDAAFYAHLYDFTPHPDIPALPVADTDADGNPRVNVHWSVQDAGGTFTTSHGTGLVDAVTALKDWLPTVTGAAPRLVSDNNGFDAMWLNCLTDAQIGALLFGHSSRRIGDFYAGAAGDWRKHSAWKGLRRTAHTHDPLDDARGNAEALRVILGIDHR